MTDYRIDYSVTTHDGEHVSGTVDVIDRTMTTNLARQYAAADLFDNHDVEPGSFDVPWSPDAIDVEWGDDQ